VPKEATQFKPGQSGNPAGRTPSIKREGENRHLVITACQEIAGMLHGPELKEAALKKKTQLWVMLYRLAQRDTKTFLGYYCGLPRQPVELDATLSSGPSVEEAAAHLAELQDRLGKSRPGPKPPGSKGGKGKK